MAYEQLIDELIDGELSVESLQELIDTGVAWRLEGSVGRMCMDAIEAGVVMLGEVAHKDYWGNTVPSRYDVVAGSKGSIEYVEKTREG